MTGMLLTWLAAPAALIIATIGAASVFKAVYIDKRVLKCACVGGNSNVPLGFVSLIENLGLMAMSIVIACNLQQTPPTHGSGPLVVDTRRRRPDSRRTGHTGEAT